MQKLTCLMLLITVTAPALAQYKCLGPGGETSFQQTPCPAGQAGQKLRITVSPSIEDGRPQRIKQAIAERRVVLGLSRQELNRVMRGPPDTVNSSIHSSGRHDQLIYRQDGRTLYVYTENDVVTSVQDTEGARVRVPVQTYSPPVRQCPSDAEIRNIEMDRSKIQNRDNDRLQAELARQLGEAQACRRGG